MVFTIPMLFQSTISNPLQEEFICLLLFINTWEAVRFVLYVLLSLECTTTIQNLFPSPYHHSNIDSEELLYYVDGDFMSRNNIEKGQITLHPGGIPHGPHPGAIERSVGKKQTEELAVMIDPFNPVMITEEALKLEVDDYYKSWININP